MNKRLLKYNLSTYDYSKIKNSAYNKRFYSRLLANYIINEYNNTDLFLKVLIKYSKNKLFEMLNTDFEMYKEVIEKDFNINLDNIDDRPRILKLQKNKNKCLCCSSELYGLKTFCNVKCSNTFKNKNKDFIDKNRESIINYYKNVDKEEQKNKNKKISNSVNIFNSTLSSEEKSEKYRNKELRYTSYSNFENLFSNLTLLVTEKEFYKRRYIDVKCKKCSNTWQITKSTAYCRVECKKCNPYKKHKQQSELFNTINEKINFKAKENSKSLLLNKEIDILIEDYNLAIEFNGLLPHSSGNSKVHYYNRKIDTNYHLIKTELCEEKEFQLFHIFEDEYVNLTKRKIWLSMINNKLNLNDRIFARKCSIELVNTKDKNLFLEQNHLQGSCNSKINIGLYYNKELVQLITFGKSRFNKNIEYELIRLCSKINFNIIGGASKLLKYFELNYKPKSLISYANRRWSTGSLYDKLGFTFINNSKPNHFYFKVNDNVLIPRTQFMKHKLKDKLEFFDENISGIQNMLNNNYRIIYDSGNKVYIKEY